MIKEPDALKPDADNKIHPLPIGDRFRYARQLCPLSRTDFCNRHGLNCYTVQSWELGRSFSRTGNVARFIEALANEGIMCTEAWLMEGVGPEPCPISAGGVFTPPITSRQLKKKPVSFYESLVQKEIELFCEHSLKMGMSQVVVQISDDAMAPDYEVGEFIGAWRVPPGHIDRLHHVVCLVETTPNHFIVRRLLKEGGSYILMALNKSTPLIRLDHLVGAAEIIWCEDDPPYFFQRKEGKEEK